VSVYVVEKRRKLGIGFIWVAHDMTMCYLECFGPFVKKEKTSGIGWAAKKADD
jgi:hypothetical protein